MSIAVDLKRKEGASVVKRLCNNADVIIEPFRVGEFTFVHHAFPTFCVCVIYCRVWQAEITFIPNWCYQQFELLISTVWIVNISILNYWYQQATHICVPLSPSSIIWYPWKLGSKQAHHVIHWSSICALQCKMVCGWQAEGYRNGDQCYAILCAHVAREGLGFLLHCSYAGAV